MNNKPMSLSSNLKWVALSKVIQIALQLISLTVLTHLLAPSEYGLMAMATVVTNFTLIVRDLGT
ncbi:MAG: oligosaccharide flippase family protein, partial [Leuconostoc mesenteroides]